MNKQEVKLNQAIVTDLLDGHLKVSTPFDSGLVEYYRSLPSRKWCSEHKYWKFPCELRIEIEGMLNKRGFEVVHRNFRPVVHILEMDGIEAQVNSNYEPEVYKTLHAVEKSRWDPIRSCFIMPNEQINGLINELNTKDIEYNYSKVTADARPNSAKKQKTSHSF